MIVKQPPYLMVPVKLERQWFDDYILKVLYEFNGLIWSANIENMVTQVWHMASSDSLSSSAQPSYLLRGAGRWIIGAFGK